MGSGSDENEAGSLGDGEGIEAVAAARPMAPPWLQQGGAKEERGGRRLRVGFPLVVVVREESDGPGITLELFIVIAALLVATSFIHVRAMAVRGYLPRIDFKHKWLYQDISVGSINSQT